MTGLSQREVYEALDSEWRTVAEIAEGLGMEGRVEQVARNTVRQKLVQLAKWGLAERAPSPAVRGVSTRWRRAA